MAYQGSITLVDLSDGQSGSSGINTATVYLYQRATTTPSGPNGTLRYTFSTCTLSGAYFNDWEQSIDDLSGSNPIWIIAATATASADVGYDDIPMGEWSNPIKMAQDGQDGQDGAPGINGINTATIYIYKRSDSIPSTPADTTYTFTDGSFIIPTNWSREVPTSNGNPCYVCSAVAIGNQTTAILEWSTPVILVEDGTDGENGISPTVESISNGVKITDAEGNITYIYDGINGTSYYTHVRYSANADGHDYVSAPTSSTIYIGVYSGTSNVAPAYNDSGWTWSKYVGEDGNPGTPGAAGVSVTEVKEVYYITSGATPTQNTLPNGTPITSTSTSSNVWTTVIPAYIANGRYYTSLQTSLSSGTSPVFSTIVLNQGLTDANANAAEANAATALLGGHFIYKSTASISGRTPASANVVQTIKDNNIDVTDDPTKWEYNTHIGANGIKLRYNENDLSSWTSQGISIYNPITHNAAMQLTGQTLNFYNPNNDRLSLSLNSNGLNFYGSSIVNPDASLTTTGLVLSKGGIQTGTSGQNGFVYLSSEDYQRKDATHSGTTINGHTPTAAGTDGKTIDDPAWREIIGTKFGVDSEGNLYANNANLSNATVEGAITATSLTIGSGNSSYSGIAAINATNYDIEIVNDINSLPEGYTANNNNTYLYPIMYHNGINVRDEFIKSLDTVIDNNKIYYTRTLVEEEYVYTRVSSPVIADIDLYYERIYPFNKFLWYEGNSSIAITGDVYNGGIVAEYGKVYKVIYNFSDDEVGEAQTVQTVYIDDTKYITKISDTGITIHPENNSGNDYLYIDANKIAIFRNNVEKMQLTDSLLRMGDSENYVSVDSDSLDIYNNQTRLATFHSEGAEIGENSTTAKIGFNKSRGSITARDLTGSITGQYDLTFGIDDTGWGNNYYALVTGLKARKVMSNTDESVSRLDIMANNNGASFNMLASHPQYNSSGDDIGSAWPSIAGTTENTGLNGVLNLKVYSTIAGTIEHEGIEIRTNINSTRTSKTTYINFTGDYITFNGTTIHSSDKRLKTHIKYLGKEAIDFISALHPAYFSLKEQKTTGFYAQEVEHIDPWNCFVNEDINGYKTLNYIGLIAPLVTYCQHLEKRITELETQLEGGNN